MAKRPKGVSVDEHLRAQIESLVGQTSTPDKEKGQSLFSSSDGRIFELESKVQEQISLADPYQHKMSPIQNMSVIDKVI